MSKAVVAVFKFENDVENAVKELDNLGYDTKEMSVFMKDVRQAKEVKDMGVHVSEGAASGAVTGGALGGLTGLLIGLGVISIPGVGPFLAAGPLVAALGLTGAAATTATGTVTGAIAGGIIGALTSLGFPPEEAKIYEEEIRGGGILLVVPTLNERTNEVRSLVEKYNAREVRELELSPQAEHLAH